MDFAKLEERLAGQAAAQEMEVTDFLGVGDLPVDSDPAGEFRKRFFPASPNPWGTTEDPTLAKLFGHEKFKTALSEKEPFDEPLRKSAGGHHFRLEKRADGSQCIFDCSGQMVACRVNGVSFDETEIAEIRKRCSCENCSA